jgi:hypothetical protein
MSRIKNFFKKITSRSKPKAIVGWGSFLLGLLVVSPDLLLLKVLLLSVARVLP